MIPMNIDMLSCLKLFIKKCQEEESFKRWSGEDLGFNKAEDGLIMKYISQNRLSYFSEELKVQMQELDYHLRVGKHLHTEKP
jgi:hypothetical protein